MASGTDFRLSGWTTRHFPDGRSPHGRLVVATRGSGRIIVIVAGVLGMEVVEAAYDAAFEHTAPYIVMVAVEETLEMVGVIILIDALLAYAGALAPGFRIIVEAPESSTG